MWIEETDKEMDKSVCRCIEMDVSIKCACLLTLIGTDTTRIVYLSCLCVCVC